MLTKDDALALLRKTAQDRNRLFALKDVCKADAVLVRGIYRQARLDKITQAQAAILLTSDNMTKLMAIISA